MPDFLIDNIFVEFGGWFSNRLLESQWVPIALLYLQIYFYIPMKQNLSKGLYRNFTFRYIDDVLSLNNNRFSDHLHLIYPSELKIKDTTDTDIYILHI